MLETDNISEVALRWLNSHPVFTCDVCYLAFRKAMDAWLAAHADDILKILRERFSEEIRAEEEEAISLDAAEAIGENNGNDVRNEPDTVP
jgi:hypothetical protein